MNRNAAVLHRLISGGQTGADRGGLDAAIRLGIAHGGCCPKGRRAEDGRVPQIYALRETTSGEYHVRTRRNVLDADGTVIFTRGRPQGGSLLTARVAREAGKPCLHIDVGQLELAADAAAVRLRSWLAEHSIQTLNVAGSRESKEPGIEAEVCRFLCAALRPTYTAEDERLSADRAGQLAAAEEETAYAARLRKRRRAAAKDTSPQGPENHDRTKVRKHDTEG